jgi:transcriptional regulator with XRE-family HTH domain
LTWILVWIIFCISFFERRLILKTLLAIRASHDLSQEEAAKMAGISAPAYWKAENGRKISPQTAKKICEAFEINLAMIEGLNIAPRRIKRPVE